MDRTPSEYSQGNTTKFNREVIDRCFNFINVSDSVLDIGCGTGETSVYMQDKFGCKVSLADINSEFVHFCIDNNKGKFTSTFVLDIESDIVQKDVPGSSFSVVTCFFVLNWIRDLGTALDNINWLLKDEGKAAIVLPTYTGSTHYHKAVFEHTMGHSMWCKWINTKRLSEIKPPWPLAMIGPSASPETPWLHDTDILKLMMEKRGFSVTLYEVVLFHFRLDEENLRAACPLINCVPGDRQEELIFDMVAVVEDIKNKECIDGSLREELPVIVMLAEKIQDIFSKT